MPRVPGTSTDPIPHRIEADLNRIEEETNTTINKLRTELMNSPNRAVTVYITDTEMRAHKPEHARFTASWWRHVVYQATQDIPGVRIQNAHAHTSEP